MDTYTNGLQFKCNREITKNDLVTLCELLNTRPEYVDTVEFKPEPIGGGGFIYIFKDPSLRGYKSVRFHADKWHWVRENVMTEWSGNHELVLKDKRKFGTFLKAFQGAPVFTMEELKIWEECFAQIGVTRVGRYPAKKYLSEKKFTNHEPEEQVILM